MREYKKVFKIFFAGNEDAETAWLSQMSKDGYHLVNVNFATYYVFKKGSPADYNYYIDMKEDGSMDEEYRLMYSDVGLEYIDNSNGYYYFRGDSESDTVAIMNNEQGRYLGRLNVQKTLLGIVSMMNILIFGINYIQFMGHNYSYSWTVYLNLLCGLLCGSLGIKMQLRINDMKKSGVKQPYKSKLKDYKTFYTLATICIVLIVVYIIIICLDGFIH